MKTLWYLLFKIYIKIGLFFYTKKIKVVGKNNVPKKGAVLFAVNHPNGLLDPLIVATNTPRVSHFLVRAAVFKKPLVKKFLATLNLMPIYRIRDGRKEISKNTEVFNDCFEILNKQQALMIFPEGSHNRKRTVRNISKGFTRIVYGALEKYPELQINIIPIGITYQNASKFPSKIAIHFGTSINANAYYNAKNPNDSLSIQQLKDAVANQLKELSVHILDNENYQETLQRLNKSNIDFTEVKKVNSQIKKKEFHTEETKINFIKPMYYIWVDNRFFPWILCKITSRKSKEIEFIDTFRAALGISIFPLFYTIQTLCIYAFFNLKTAVLYAGFSIILTLIYVKFSTTPTESHPE